MVNEQTLCLPCATPLRSEDGTFQFYEPCPECGELNYILRESGYIACDMCWHDELSPDFEDDYIL